jgi:hypothetical protein
LLSPADDIKALLEPARRINLIATSAGNQTDQKSREPWQDAIKPKPESRELEILLRAREKLKKRSEFKKELKKEALNHKMNPKPQNLQKKPYNYP